MLIKDLQEPHSSITPTRIPKPCYGIIGKHVLHVSDILCRIDSNKVIYPNGVVGELKQSEEEASPVKRIELFAEEKSKELYGIIRKFFVAYSSERKLLELAQASNNVISIKAIHRPAGSRRELKILSRGSLAEQSEIVEDKMILRLLEEGPEQYSFRVKLPCLIVSPRWLDRMELEVGDRIIISNPIESYLVPPPNLAD